MISAAKLKTARIALNYPKFLPHIPLQIGGIVIEYTLQCYAKAYHRYTKYQRYTKYIYAKYNFQINKEDIYGKKNENHGW